MVIREQGWRRFHAHFRRATSYTCWRLGFRQYSFDHIARVPQRPVPAHGHGRCFPGMLLSPSPFGSWVSHQTQEYPPNSSRLNREYNRAPRGAAISLCTSIPATRSYSTFIRPATSCSGTPHSDGNGRAACQDPGSVQETDTRARSSTGGYPAWGPCANLTSGLERSKPNRRRQAARQHNCAPSAPAAASPVTHQNTPAACGPHPPRREGTQLSQPHGSARGAGE